jgi:hypothetical protein
MAPVPLIISTSLSSGDIFASCRDLADNEVFRIFFSLFAFLSATSQKLSLPPALCAMAIIYATLWNFRRLALVAGAPQSWVPPHYSWTLETTDCRLHVGKKSSCQETSLL